MHIAFVTTELDPIVPGGAGVLVRRLRDALEAAADRVTVVAAADQVGRDDAAVRATGDDDAGWDLSFMARSKAAAEAVADVHAHDPVDLVEVQDFDGLAFWLLTHRGDLGFANTPITVRFHGPVDLQVEAIGTSTAELDAVAVMERESYAMADSVTVPSPGIRDLVVDRYGVADQRVLIGSPIVPTSSGALRWSDGGTDFLVIGRLGEVKGSHDMVDAAIPVLTDHPELTLTFAGADGWSATANRPMQEWLGDRIPRGVRDRIRFAGHLERWDLDERIAACRAVVVPSRFESFHLAAHEARRLGAPLIVPDLPAFHNLLDPEHGAEVYDGSVPGLEAALRRACDQSWSVPRADRPPPDLPDPLAPYRASIVPHHRRSQGGLATAAIARLEEAWLTPRRTPPASLGRRALERVPEGVYGFAKRLVPNRVKDRIREATDLGAEADRRTWEERFTRAAAGMAERAGSEDPPRVSVVIPCYNQGPFIREALLSVFEQTVGDIEVVVVDDGSDDAVTGPLLDGLSIRGVRVIRTPNAGLPAARNTGIGAAAGEFVVTLDADDMLAPDYTDRLLGAVEESKDHAYAHCWAELFGDTHSIWATRPFNPYQLMLSNSVVGCVLLRKSAWEDVGGYDESMRSGNEDWDLWIRLAAAGYGEAQVRAPLFRYRKHGVSMSVETESRYEEALDDRVARHPELYGVERMRRLKHEHYPLLSVLDGGSVPSGRWDGDIQVIPGSADTLAGMVDRVRAKYVTWLPPGSDVDIEVLVALCRTLEGDEDAGAATTSGEAPVTVVRRWSLHDPAAPARVVTTDARGSAPDRLVVGALPLPQWQVPEAVDGVPVIRQRPEEAGIIPSWVTA